jgi:hypothetical protein
MAGSSRWGRSSLRVVTYTSKTTNRLSLCTPPPVAAFFAILSYLGELPLIIVLDLLFSIA